MLFYATRTESVVIHPMASPHCKMFIGNHLVGKLLYMCSFVSSEEASDAQINCRMLSACVLVVEVNERKWYVKSI